jgi:hypothetical protein
MQTIQGDAQSGEGNFDFCFYDSLNGDITVVDSFRWVFFDLDERGAKNEKEGIGIKEKILILDSSIEDYSLWPTKQASQVKLFCEGEDEDTKNGFNPDARQPPDCLPNERIEFRSSVNGFGDDNPTDPEDLTAEQKKRSVAFTFKDTSCFRVVFNHYCPVETDTCRWYGKYTTVLYCDVLYIDILLLYCIVLYCIVFCYSFYESNNIILLFVCFVITTY